MSKAEGGRSHQQTDVQSLPGKQSLNMLNGYLNGKANAITINASFFPSAFIAKYNLTWYVTSLCSVRVRYAWYVPSKSCPPQAYSLLGKRKVLYIGVINTISATNSMHSIYRLDRRKVNFLASSWQELVQFLVKAAHLLHETRGQEDRRVNSFTGEVIKNRIR